MVADRCWRELCRFDDLLSARAVATSIAAMEFDVRLCAADAPAEPPPEHAHDHPGRPPFVVEVRSRHWHDLADVIDEIIAEQREFDLALESRRGAGRPARLVAVIALTGTVDLVILLSSLDW